MDAREWLDSQGVKLRRFAVGDFKTTCPRCSAGRRNKKEPCLSVTVNSTDDVVVNCHHCGWSEGNVAKGEYKSTRRHWTKPTPPAREEGDFELMLEWFRDRGISADTVANFGIFPTRQWFPQSDREERCAAFPYRWNGEVWNHKYRTGRSKMFRQDKEPRPVLFNADCIHENIYELIFVEGEMDVLAMAEVGITNAVSLPNGAPNPGSHGGEKRYEPLETHAAELEKIERIVIATDDDEAGDALAEELSRRLGIGRCYRVRMIEGDQSFKDANDALMAGYGQMIARCLAQAKPWPVPGLEDVEAYEAEVYDSFDGKGPQPLSLGWREMDKALKVLPGQLVVITGIPNHGKSRWVDNVIIRTMERHRWSWAMFSPETDEIGHLADLAETYQQKPFHDGPTERMSRDELREAMEWLKDYLVIIEPMEDAMPSVDWIIERAKAAVLRRGIRGLVIDPWNEVEASRPRTMTETEFVSSALSKLKRFAKMYGVTIFVVAHPAKPDQRAGVDEPPSIYSIAGSAHWRNKADAALIVHRDFSEDITKVIVEKVRRQPMCGRPGTVKFEFRDWAFRDRPGSYTAKGGRPE
jgi:twinkle protein